MATRREAEGRKVVGGGGGDGVEVEAVAVAGKNIPETAKSTKASAKEETAAGRSPQVGTEGDAGAAAILVGWAVWDPGVLV
jgi:hypothetical protein